MENLVVPDHIRARARQFLEKPTHFSLNEISILISDVDLQELIKLNGVAAENHGNPVDELNRMN